MKLYENFVNYSVFDGEITLSKDAQKHLLETVFSTDTSNRDIRLLINEVAYSARLMNVPSSQSVQISYKQDVKDLFRKTFPFSYDYVTSIRAEAKNENRSTRDLPPQKVETIIIRETSNFLEYEVECLSPYSNGNEYDPKHPEEESISFPEGKLVYSTHIRHERNPGLVAYAKMRFKERHHSLFCEVCGFSFDVYGDRGKDFIEAHHDVIPISEMDENTSSRIEDIRMVCSNCHKILHLKRPWLHVNELKESLQHAHVQTIMPQVNIETMANE